MRSFSAFSEFILQWLFPRFAASGRKSPVKCTTRRRARTGFSPVSFTDRLNISFFIGYCNKNDVTQKRITSFLQNQIYIYQPTFQVHPYHKSIFHPPLPQHTYLPPWRLLSLLLYPQKPHSHKVQHPYPLQR